VIDMNATMPWEHEERCGCDDCAADRWARDDEGRREDAEQARADLRREGDA
jgi:hypothetical protein